MAKNKKKSQAQNAATNVQPKPTPEQVPAPATGHVPDCNPFDSKCAMGNPPSKNSTIGSSVKLSPTVLPATPSDPQFELLKRIGNEYKNRANDLFKASQFLKARDAYNEAIRSYSTHLVFHFSRVDPVLYLNRGFVSLKLLQYVDAEEDFTIGKALKELETDKGHYTQQEVGNYRLKCLWRRAEARKVLGNFDMALEDLNQMKLTASGSSIVSLKELGDKVIEIQGLIKEKGNGKGDLKNSTGTIGKSNSCLKETQAPKAMSSKKAATLPNSTVIPDSTQKADLKLSSNSKTCEGTPKTVTMTIMTDTGTFENVTVSVPTDDEMSLLSQNFPSAIPKPKSVNALQKQSTPLVSQKPGSQKQASTSAACTVKEKASSATLPNQTSLAKTVEHRKGNEKQVHSAVSTTLEKSLVHSTTPFEKVSGKKKKTKSENETLSKKEMLEKYLQKRTLTHHDIDAFLRPIVSGWGDANLIGGDTNGERVVIEEEEDHSGCGPDPTPILQTFFASLKIPTLVYPTNVDQISLKGTVSHFNTKVMELLPCFSTHCTRSTDTFLALDGFTKLSQKEMFISQTAFSLLTLFTAVGSCLEDDACKQHLLPQLSRLISVTLEDGEASAFGTLLSFLNTCILQNVHDVEAFYTRVDSSIGTKLLSAVCTRFSDAMCECMSFVKKLFAYSPSWLQRKYAYNLKQTITLVKAGLENEEEEEELFQDCICIVRDICGYVEMRNGSGLMPIKSRKLFEDIEHMTRSVCVRLSKMLKSVDERSVDKIGHVFGCLESGISVLPFELKGVGEFIREWILYLGECEDVDVVDQVVCCIQALMKRNKCVLEEEVVKIDTMGILRLQMEACIEDGIRVFSMHGNENLVYLLHLGMKKSVNDKRQEEMREDLFSRRGYVVLCKFLKNVEGEAEMDGYDGKYVKCIIASVECLEMFLERGKEEYCLGVKEQGLLPVLDRLKEAYKDRSMHKVFQTVIDKVS